MVVVMVDVDVMLVHVQQHVSTVAVNDVRSERATMWPPLWDPDPVPASSKASSSNPDAGARLTASSSSSSSSRTTGRSASTICTPKQSQANDQCFYPVSFLYWIKLP
mmetsp:Transcript_27980/g.67916  ORF Transcript_27980/g.67916 Transcript_27980/m.67916 type:complete len:107 (+) Transcript_27980:248-568(+)